MIYAGQTTLPDVRFFIANVFNITQSNVALDVMTFDNKIKLKSYNRNTLFYFWCNYSSIPNESALWNRH